MDDSILHGSGQKRYVENEQVFSANQKAYEFRDDICYAHMRKVISM